MDLRHLRYFVAAAEQLHFARAAELLEISPPTLTVQIQELEAALQVKLFQRSKRAVSLTTAGEAFLLESRAVLERMERAIHTGRRAGRGELGRIEIGYVGSAVYAQILQQQLRLYRIAWPDVIVHARELPMPQLPSLLDEGAIDMALVRLPMNLPPQLASHVLSRDQFCLALPREHGLATQSTPIEARQLAAESFVVPEQDRGLIEVARRGGFMPRIAAAPGGLVAVVTQVSLGVGVAIVPAPIADVFQLPNVGYQRLAGAPIYSEVAAIYRRHEHSPTVRQLIAQIRQAEVAGQV